MCSCRRPDEPVSLQDSVLRPRGSKTVLARMPLDRRAYQRLLGCTHTRARITGGGGKKKQQVPPARALRLLFIGALCVYAGVMQADRRLCVCLCLFVHTHTHTTAHNRTIPHTQIHRLFALQRLLNVTGINMHARQDQAGCIFSTQHGFLTPEGARSIEPDRPLT